MVSSVLNDPKVAMTLGKPAWHACRLLLGGGEAQRFPAQHLAEDARDQQSRLLPQRCAPEASAYQPL